MISAIVVILDRLKEFLDIFIESIVTKSKHISEVIIVNVDKPQGDMTSWTEHEITFKLLGGKPDFFKIDAPITLCSQHAFGLHLGLERSTNDYIMFSDPDVFFYSHMDEHYLSLMNEHNLNFIGVCQPAAVTHGMQFFPTVINCLIKKSDLPPDDFGKEICPLNTMMTTNCDESKFATYLYPMATHLIPQQWQSKFPNPNGHYETGSRLFVWALEQNWRWFSYPTQDQNNYYKNLYRNNFGFKLKLPKEKLLYHESLSSGFPDKINVFKKAYKEIGVTCIP
jgi:hypothetical protein